MFVTVPVQRRVVRTPALPRAFAQFVANAVETAAQQPRLPALDVLESDSAYTLVLDLPGVAREQLKVSVEGQRVTVETEQPAPAAEAPATPATAEGETATAAPAPVAAQPRTVYSERRAPRYARTVTLPAEVDADTSQARLDNGVLTLVLAKRVPGGVRRISVA